MPRTFARRTARAAALLLAGVAALPAAAPAADVVTPNACYYAYDAYWRPLDLRLAGESKPVYVPPGAGYKLQKTAIATTLPAWIPEYGFNLGLLNAGRNTIPAEVWVSIAGTGSAQGDQWVKAAVTAETTITASADGQKFVSATPVAVTVPLPDTTWTAPTEEGGKTTFTQGRPGTLPEIPGVDGGKTTRPKGSVFIRARLNNATVFDLDCLPGSTAANSSNTYIPGTAGAFDINYVDPTAPPTGIAAPPVVSPALLLVKDKLKAKRSAKTLRLALRNPGAIEAINELRVRTAGKVRVGKSKKKSRVTLQGWTRLTASATSNASAKVKLSSKARTLLKGSKKLSLVVELRAATDVAASKPKFGKVSSFPLTLTLKK